MMEDVINPLSLVESTALIPVECNSCLETIDIGDSCYIDFSEGIEEAHAKIFCEECIKRWWQDN